MLRNFLLWHGRRRGHYNTIFIGNLYHNCFRALRVCRARPIHEHNRLDMEKDGVLGKSRKRE